MLDDFDTMLAELLAAEDYPVVKVPSVISELIYSMPPSLFQPGIKARLPFDVRF